MFQSYTEDYERQLCQRIAEERKNRIGIEKQLKIEKRKRDEIVKIPRNASKSTTQQEQEAEAKKRLETEVMHQTEEAETRALGNKMMSDAASKKPSFNTSCANLLNNFQGMLNE